MIKFKDKNAKKDLDIQLALLNSTLKIQKELNKQILIFTKSFADGLSIDGFANDDFVRNINDAMLLLNQSNKNISDTQNIIDVVNGADSKRNGRDINDYQQLCDSTLSDIFAVTSKIEKFIYAMQISQFKKTTDETTSVVKDNSEQTNLDTIDTISSTELNCSFSENTLVISETQGKIILPYTLEEINRILLTKSDTYSSIENVINDVYTLPIKKYKHSSIARFREAYRLMMKNNCSKLKALSLASELFMNYNIHPAVITACKSIDELDVYLACLEDNSLHDFRFFDIKYEIPPIATNV